MPRVKRGKVSVKKRKTILKHTKGFKWGRKSKERAAKEALLHAWSHSFADRRKKKRDMRRLWQTKIKSLTEINGLKYNQLINSLKKADVQIDRKIMAEIAEKHENVFKEILEKVK